MSDAFKMAAAQAALDYIEPGMLLGLGTGSTAAHLVRALGKKVHDGLTITAIATSEATEDLARQVGVPIGDFDATPRLDLTIDGADEIGPGLALIKGGGGALLREKIVAYASERMIVIADESKQVQQLGAFGLPIEVVPFGWEATRLAIQDIAIAFDLACELTLRRKDGELFRTDSQNIILDASFGLILAPGDLDAALRSIPGLVETGLFVNIAETALVAGENGIAVITQ